MALILRRILCNKGFRGAVPNMNVNCIKGQALSSAASTHAGTATSGAVVTERRGVVMLIGLNRPEVRNAVNQETAHRLAEELSAFDQDDSLNVAVLHGFGGNFCAGFDLKEVAQSSGSLKLEQDVCRGPGPMGPSRLRLSKPLIAAVSGYAVAGGLELALLADLRVVEESSVMGVFCRRFALCACEAVPQTVCLYCTPATQEEVTSAADKSSQALTSTDCRINMRLQSYLQRLSRKAFQAAHTQQPYVIFDES